jgi:hypothetical protein
MDRQNPDTGSLSRFIWHRSTAAVPYHGLLIFVGQILLVLIVPLVGRVGRTAPLAHVIVATLEGLCGILYPATLIARIASLPAPGESGKCW